MIKYEGTSEYTLYSFQTFNRTKFEIRKIITDSTDTDTKDKNILFVLF